MKLARRDYEGRSWIKIGDEPTDLVIGVFKLNSDGTDYDYDNPKNFYKRIKTVHPEAQNAMEIEQKNLDILQKWILKSHKDAILNNVDISNGLHGKFTFSCFINGGWTDEEPMTLNEIFEKYKKCFLGWEFVHAFIRIEAQMLEYEQQNVIEVSPEIEDIIEMGDIMEIESGINGEDFDDETYGEGSDQEFDSFNNQEEWIEPDNYNGDDTNDYGIPNEYPTNIHETSYKCENCDKLFWNPENLTAHVKNVHERVKEFQCNECEEAFFYKFQLSSHQRRIHEGVTNDFSCEPCGKEYRSKWSLKMHVNSVHDKVTYPCDFCEKIYKEETGLQYHVQSKHIEGNDVYQCQQCDSSFVMEARLRNHVKVVHEKVKDVPCPRCEKMFKNNSDMKVHVKLIHDKIRDYVCNHCNKAFGTCWTMQKHIDHVHKKIKEFKCVPCDKDFSCSSSFKKHVLRIHESGKAFNCKDCHKVFKMEYDRLKHYQIVHLKLKNYKCDFCDLTFGQSSNKHTHMKKYHLEQLNKDV